MTKKREESFVETEKALLEALREQRTQERAAIAAGAAISHKRRSGSAARALSSKARSRPNPIAAPIVVR